MIVILTGVSGSGKTTVGRLLAKKLNWPFIDADDLHSEDAVDKMKNGIPLSDDDRLPWLKTIRTITSKVITSGNNAIISCSALKESYRETLKGDSDNLYFVFLKGDFDLIEKRLAARKNHFMHTNLLASQFTDLAEPKDALIVDISKSPEEIVKYIINKLKLNE